MNREKVTEFISKFLHARVSSITNEWVNISCPFASFRHRSGKDSHPSFGISYGSNKTSYFKCYSCSPDAQQLLNLPFVLWLNGDKYPSDALKFILENEFLEEQAFFDDGDTINPTVTMKYFESKVTRSIPKDIINIFPKISNVKDHYPALNYLHFKRGISIYNISKYGVRCDPIKELVVFPLTNMIGDIKVLRARRWKDKKMFTISPNLFGLTDIEFPSPAKDGVWFGMEHLDVGNPVMFVEGEIDALRLATLGFDNVLASCTSNVTEKQLSKIPNNHIILGFDADDAGEKATKRVISFYKDKIIHKIDWGIIDKKDAGDLVEKDELDFLLSKQRLLKIRSKFNVQKNT